MNETIRRKLIEIERSLKSIDQQYKYATNLDRFWRKRQIKKEKRKAEKKKEKWRLEIETDENSEQPREVQAIITLSQVWPRRQKEQKILARPTLIEKIKKTNTMIVSNPIKSSVRINRSQFEQIFIISYVEKKLDQVQKLI